MPQPAETLDHPSKLTRRTLLAGATGLVLIAAVDSQADIRPSILTKLQVDPRESVRGTMLSKNNPIIRDAIQNFDKLASPESTVTNQDMFDTIQNLFDRSGAVDQFKVSVGREQSIFLGHHQLNGEYEYSYIDFADWKSDKNVFVGFKKLEDGNIQPYDSDFDLDPDDGDFPVEIDQRGLRIISAAVSRALANPQFIEVV